MMAIFTPHLLITDDDRAFRETLQSVFEPRGFRTSLAADGEEAVSIARNSDVHLLLIDMHMPRLTGLEAVHRLRAFKIDLPCVLISGGLDEQTLRQAEQDEAIFSVLTKPIRSAEVTDTVRRALQTVYQWIGL
jgi:two-component system chemotaxis response regulator CheY